MMSLTTTISSTSCSSWTRQLSRRATSGRAVRSSSAFCSSLCLAESSTRKSTCADCVVGSVSLIRSASELTSSSLFHFTVSIASRKRIVDLEFDFRCVCMSACRMLWCFHKLISVYFLPSSFDFRVDLDFDSISFTSPNTLAPAPKATDTAKLHAFVQACK